MAGIVSWQPPGHIYLVLQLIFDLKNYMLSNIKVPSVKQRSVVTLINTLHAASNSSKHLKCIPANAAIFVGGLLMLINVLYLMFG